MFPALRQVLIEFLEKLFKKKIEEPLVLTSRPVKVKDIWGWSGGFRRRSFLSSLIAHSIAVTLIFIVFQPIKEIFPKTGSAVSLIEISPYLVKIPPGKGGGGGGDKSPLPASKGRIPRPAPRQFTPPAAVAQNLNPKLIMEPTLVIPPDVNLPSVNLPGYGDPFAKLGPPSGGPGSGGGIGSGSGGGVGPGKGPGLGPGEGGGFGGGVFRAGGGVTAPTAIYRVEPDYSEEARKAKFQGTVIISAIVDIDGIAKNIQIMRPLGLGLDEKAVEAVAKWRFKPGTKGGKPVPVFVTFEVNFRLL